MLGDRIYSLYSIKTIMKNPHKYSKPDMAQCLIIIVEEFRCKNL